MPQIGKKSALRKIKKNILTAGPEALGCLVGSPHLNSRSCASGGFSRGTRSRNPGWVKHFFCWWIFFSQVSHVFQETIHICLHIFIYTYVASYSSSFSNQTTLLQICVCIYICVECAVSASNGELRARNTTQGAPKNDTLL